MCWSLFRCGVSRLNRGLDRFSGLLDGLGSLSRLFHLVHHNRLRGGLLSLWLCLLGLGLRVNGLENQLDDGHRGVVALAVTGLHNAGVTTFTLIDLRCDLHKQLVDCGLVADDCHHPATSVQVTALGKGHHALGERAQALGLGLRGLDTTVGEQSGCEVRQHEALVSRSASQAGSFRGSRHCCVLFRVSQGNRRGVDS